MIWTTARHPCDIYRKKERLLYMLFYIFLVIFLFKSPIIFLISLSSSCGYMTFNILTLDCTCFKCSYSWKARTDEAPKKCPSCGSMAWNFGVRKYTSIISRAGPEMPDGSREFCILELLTHPVDETDDIFYLSADSLKTYFYRAKMPIGSALIFIGEFEIGEDRVLYIKDLKLVYCHERAFRAYNSLNLIYQKKL